MQVKRILPEEMVTDTPDPRWELEIMTVDDVCDFLNENGFPDHVLDTFRGKLWWNSTACMTSKCVYLLHAMVVPQSKSWMDRL